MSRDITKEVTTTDRAGEASVPAIEMEDLCKTFGTLRAVDHLTLSVQQGEIFGLLGPNGSGKTTTINMVSGLSAPSSGDVRVMGYDIRHNVRRVRQILGSVPQETALYEELSAWTNMDFHADLFGIPRKEKRERITRMLELVQLLDRKDSRVSTFSGGMKRQLALARALLHDPQLIYLDEPTLGVDVQSRRAIWDYILSLRDQGKSILITTNYLEEAQALVTLFSSGLGVACGALLQRVQPVIAISVLTALYLFFLAGGITVLAFEPVWLQNIAAFVPLTYGNHALQMAIFYSSSDQLLRDVGVLGGSALVAVGLGVLARRRGTAS